MARPPDQGDEYFGLGYLIKGQQPATKGAKQAPATQQQAPSSASEQGTSSIDALLRAVARQLLGMLEQQPGGRADIRQVVDHTGIEYDGLMPVIEMLEQEQRLTTERDRYGMLTLALTPAPATPTGDQPDGTDG